MADSSRIAAEIEPVVVRLGLSLYDVEVSGTGRATVVRVLVDREGGVDLAAITDATNAITPLLDQPPLAGSLRGSYTLEVSSPGLERPLRRPEHFRAATGAVVSVKLRLPGEPAQRVRGILTTADGDALHLDVNGDPLVIPLDAVIQARTVFEWPKEVARR